MKILLVVLVITVTLVGLIGAGLAVWTYSASAAPITGVGESSALAQAQVADMTVSLSERFLNQQFRKGLPSGGEVREVTLDLHNGNRADFSALVDIVLFTRISVRPRAALLLTVQNGRIAISVQQVDVGGIGIPSNLIESQVNDVRSNAERQLNQQLAQIGANTGLTLHSLTTTETGLTIVFSQ